METARTIRIDSECYMDDEWKGYIYGPEDEFDEVFVITGNNDYKEIASASWYNKAVEYLRDHDFDITYETITDVLRKLFPDDEFEWRTITGCVQGEYQEVLYKRNAITCDDINELFECLGDFYFGYVTEIYDEEENCATYVANSEMWKHDDDLKEFIKDLLCVGDDEKVRFIKSNGYVMTKKWEEI